MGRIGTMVGKRAMLWLGVIDLAVVFASSAAQAQVSSREGIALQNQIAELRSAVTQLQSGQPGQSGGPTLPPPQSTPLSTGGSDLTAQLLERVNTLEDQNRQMRGELDQLTNQVQQQNATLSKQISDMNFAAQNGQSASSQASAASSPTQNSPTPPSGGQPAPLAADPLQAGRQALMQRDYATAERNARAALASAKTTPAKMDAQYLIAQSLAGQKQYRQSAVAYYDAYARSPRAPRAQDALLGVAATMLALGDKSSACQALQKLHAEFANPQPRVQSAAQAFSGRAGCH